MNDADSGADAVDRRKAVERGGASTSQMGRSETELLANDPRTPPSRTWPKIAHHAGELPRMTSTDSSVSPTRCGSYGTAILAVTCLRALFGFAVRRSSSAAFATAEKFARYPIRTLRDFQGRPTRSTSFSRRVASADAIRLPAIMLRSNLLTATSAGRPFAGGDQGTTEVVAKAESW